MGVLMISDYIDLETGGVKAKTLDRVRKEYEEDPEFAGYLAIMFLEMSNAIVEKNNAAKEN